MSGEPLLSESDMESASIDDLSATIEACKAARTAVRLANQEKVRELKAQIGEFQQRRSRKGDAEPSDAEKPKKKKKKKNRDRE